MTRRVRHTQDLAAPVERVFELLTSPRWVQLRRERFQDGTELLRHEPAPDGGVLVEVRRELPAGAPGFLVRFLPQDGGVRESADWDAPGADGARRGTWRADLPGAPARLGGTLRLEPAAGGSRYTVEGEVQVSVPLVGGRAEAFVAEMVQTLAGKEGELLRDSLGV